MRILTAEVEHVKRSIVYVDIDALLDSTWAPDRAGYDSDEQFAKGVLREIGYDLLDPCDVDDSGIAIEGEFDDFDITYLGIREYSPYHSEREE